MGIERESLAGLIDEIGPELIGLAIAFACMAGVNGWRFLRRTDRISDISGGQQPNDPDSKRAGGSIFKALTDASLALAFPVAGYYDRQGWAFGLAATIAGGSLLLWLWRRLNDPEPPEFPLWPEVSFPRESVIGFSIAISIVGLMLTVGLLTL